MSNALPSPEPSPIRDIGDLADRITDQPSLFGDLPDVGTIRAAKEFVHTGKTTMANGERVVGIMAAWLQTGSMSEAARLCKVSRNTISAVIRILEENGKLERLKDRFERARMEAGVATAQMIQEVLDSGKRDTDAAAMLRAGWVGLGVVSQAIAAPPPVVPVSHTHLHLHGPTSLDTATEYERMMRAATVDVQSEAVAPKLLAANAGPSLDTVLDTTSASDLVPASVPLATPPTAPKGGGGGAQPCRAANTDGKS